eukprot:9528842-Lingulodinium_polyedra.AAC.1
MLARPGLTVLNEAYRFVADAPLDEARPLPAAVAGVLRVVRGLIFLVTVSLDQDPSPVAYITDASAK